ncbi:hypothetical protein Hanom_Chr14g01278271 [Helianthus anomalus]
MGFKDFAATGFTDFAAMGFTILALGFQIVLRAFKFICLLLAEDIGFMKFCWDVINVSKLNYGMDKFPFLQNLVGCLHIIM